MLMRKPRTYLASKPKVSPIYHEASDVSPYFACLYRDLTDTYRQALNYPKTVNRKILRQMMTR